MDPAGLLNQGEEYAADGEANLHALSSDDDGNATEEEPPGKENDQEKNKVQKITVAAESDSNPDSGTKTLSAVENMDSDPIPGTSAQNIKTSKKREPTRKIPADEEAIPSDLYKKISTSKKLKGKSASFGGIDPGQLKDSDCGSYYNEGDGRVGRSVYREDLASLSITSMSFNPKTWECSACPKKHPILGGGGESRGGGRKPVLVLCDQNFPAVLPTVSGKCVAILRIEHGKLDELGELLCKLVQKNLLPRGTVILGGSLSHLMQENLASYATGIVKLKKKLDFHFGGSVVFIPFIPPPLGGTNQPQLIRRIVDGCNWLITLENFQLAPTMSDLICQIKEMGEGEEVGVHYDDCFYLPNTIEDYKGRYISSPGYQDLPATLGVWPAESEKRFVTKLLVDLNSETLTDLDTAPNLSRSAKRPAMHSALRNGEVDAAIIVGGSNAGKLAKAAHNLGLDCFRITTPGWKLTANSA